MNIIDVIIWLLLIAGLVAGFRNGILKQATSLVGMLIVIFVAYTYKGILADFFYKYFPFFDFAGIKSLNILLYETLSFVILTILLLFILRLILKLVGVVDQLVKLTLVLNLPSKLLGAVIGFVEMYVVVFFLIFIFIQPELASSKLVQESKSAASILHETPMLSNYMEDKVEVFQDVYQISQDIVKEKVDDANYEILDILLKNNVIKITTLEYIVKKDKLAVPQLVNLKEKYK